MKKTVLIHCVVLATGKPDTTGLLKFSFDAIFYADKEYYVFINLISTIGQILVGTELKYNQN